MFKVNRPDGWQRDAYRATTDRFGLQERQCDMLNASPLNERIMEAAYVEDWSQAQNLLRTGGILSS